MEKKTIWKFDSFQKNKINNNNTFTFCTILPVFVIAFFFILENKNHI